MATFTSGAQTMLPSRAGESGMEINTAEANPQPHSPLFLLPAELRQQIYEYVIGAGQIHIILRSCTPEEAPLIRLSTTTQDITMHDYQKLTYSTCTNPTSFHTRYALSKTPSSNIPIMYYNSRGHLPHLPPPATSSFILPNWGMQHARCYSAAQRDMVLQKYASTPCAVHNEYVRHDSRNCVSCMEQSKILELDFGPPKANLGLKKLHADSAVSVDGLLRSCRMIYGEARELPFKLYSFDVGTGVDLEAVLETWLEPWQVFAMERLHVSSEIEALGTVGDLVEKFMSGLKVLEVDVGGDVVNLVWVRRTRWKVEKVEVVAGFDWDCRIGRKERRELAETLEEGLMGREKR